MRNRCVNIDWLEVYVLESPSRYPCDADYFEAHGYNVRRREYGTRVYKEMFTIMTDHDEPLLEVRRNPASIQGRDGGLFPKESAHVRLCNRTCYAPNAIDILRQFLSSHDYELMRIFRLDVCLDFTRFDRGDDPAKFMARFMRGVYSKVNQSRISAHGSDQWHGRVWNSISWGNPKSMVSTKFYNKTLELSQVSQKPYIMQAWFESGLIDTPFQCVKCAADGRFESVDVWRVEFSIKSSARRWFIVESGGRGAKSIALPHSLDMYDTHLKLLTCFASLARHYFRFKIYEEDQRKDRCKDKVLFEFSPIDTFYKIDRLASHTAKTKPLDRLIANLSNFALTHPSAPLQEAVRVVIGAIEDAISRQYLGSHSCASDVLLLRQLIAERCHLASKPDLNEHRDQIAQLITDLFDDSYH